FKKHVKKLIYIQTFLIVVLLVALAYFSYQKFFINEITIEYAKDECGPIGGRISHSLKNEGECDNMCHAICSSKDKELKESLFDFKTTPCYTCECHCN
ncbi:hypothetical protein HN451_07610, partial [archaeon]|nr:hypothetical protein [archaeon]